MPTELVYGVEPVLAVLEAGRRRAAELLLARAKGGGVPEKIIAAARKRGAAVKSLERKDLDKLLSGAVHQGVALRAEPYVYADVYELLDRPAEKEGRRLLVALAGIEDPRNLGAILRSAAAVGAAGAVLPARRASPVTPAALKASAGLAESLDTALATNLARTLEEAKKKGWWVLGTDREGDGPPWSMDLDRDLVVLVGGEGKGLGPLLKKSCDMTAALPMARGVESLNAAVAASVVLYEIRRVQGWKG